jgi:transcriptional regulator with XRE-family HTH domain
MKKNNEPSQSQVNAATEPPAVMLETLSVRVSRLMAEQGFNQTSFAKKVGMERTELSRALSGKRQFQPAQIDWIAKGLGVRTADLLEGVEVPESLNRARKELEELAQRIIAAEAERDRTVAELKTAEGSFEQERARWAKERQEAQQALKRAVDEVEATARAREKSLQGQIRDLENRVTALSETETQAALALTRSQAKVVTLEGQLRSAQGALVQEQGKKVTAGVLAGLAGMLLGGALSGSDEDG